MAGDFVSPHKFSIEVKKANLFDVADGRTEMPKP